MSEKERATLRNAIVSAAISAVVTVVIALLSFSMTYGRLTQQATQIAKDVDRVLVSIDSIQKQNSTLCERVASLEAQIRMYQTGKGGSP